MKITAKLLFFMLLLLGFVTTFALLICAETVNGHLDFYYEGKHIVNNDWTVDTESGLLTIISKNVLSTDYNETGTGQKDFPNSWYAYKDQIKKVVLDGTFSKVSNNAFRDYKNLQEVVITEKVHKIDSNAFMGCSSLSTVYIAGSTRREGAADLRNVPVISQYVLFGTAVKTVYLSPEITSIANNGLPAGLTHIYGTKGTTAESYAASKNIPFSDLKADTEIKIYIGDWLYKTYYCIKGEQFNEIFFEYNGKIYTVFSDRSCTVHYDNTKAVSRSMSLYAKPLLSFNGWSVRVKDYKGLRSIFEYDTTSLAGNIKISEMGAIVGHSKYALDDFNAEERSVTKIPIYSGGERVGRILRAEKDNKGSFAVTIVGFEGSNSEFTRRALKNTVFRGYITLYNQATNQSHTLYTDAVGTTLLNASEQYLKYGKGTNSEKDFVRQTVTLTKSSCNETRYDKETLMSVLTDIYNDNGKLLVGEEIGPKKTANDIQNSFKESSGAYPSIIGMDLACYGIQLMTCSSSYRTDFLKALIDYCRAGGIITASSHFQNPTGNWTSSGLCRGYLGESDMWEALLTKGNALNDQLNKELEVNADFLRELGNNDIPILWRPFHEMNGGWFWWCIKQENGYLVPKKYFQRLWIYVYDYYVEELGLTNLIWVYSPNNDKGNLVDVDYCYPGDDYVDMTGLDWYTDGSYEIGSSRGAYKKMMAHGMPVAITEYGSSKKLDSIETWNDVQRMYADGMKVTYIMTWTGDHRFSQAGKAAELMAKPDTLSRNEVYELFKAK